MYNVYVSIFPHRRPPLQKNLIFKIRGIFYLLSRLVVTYVLTLGIPFDEIFVVLLMFLQIYNVFDA